MVNKMDNWKYSDDIGYINLDKCKIIYIEGPVIFYVKAVTDDGYEYNLFQSLSEEECKEWLEKFMLGDKK